MKFLKYRDNFLHNNNDLKDQIDNSKLIREYLENDITWGDSYFGRLINSTLGVLKRGVQSLISIPTLLNDLESNLKEMVDRVYFEEISNEYPTLYLKSLLEEIRNVCYSTLQDEKKLEILIGWDGTTSMYDADYPLKDIPGIYVGRKIIRQSLVQDVYNKIDDPVNRERLESAFNPKVIKSFLDTLSDFMDKLRKMTVPVGSPTPLPSGPSKFNLDLLDTLKKIVAVNLNESIKNKFLSYRQFINEDQSTENNLNKLKDFAKNLLSQIQNKSEEEIKNLEDYKSFVTIIQNLNDEEKQILSKNEIFPKIQNLFGTNTEKQQTDVILNTQLQKNKTTNTEEKSVTNKADVSKTQLSPSIKTSNTSSINDNPKTSVETQSPSVKKDDVLQTNKNTTITNQNGQDEKVDKNSSQIIKPESETVQKNQQPLVTKEDDVKNQPTTDDDNTEEQEKKLEELSNLYSSYIKLILEASPPPPPTSGSTSSLPPPPGPTGSTAPPTENVKDVWEKFFGEINKVLPAKLTQEDIDKIKSFDPKQIDWAFAVKKTPNPILKIVRICEKANAVYTCNSIPSGRENGEVWPSTFNKYFYVGSGQPGTHKAPGGGGWVYLPLFNQWKDGIFKIIGKDTFKKIFTGIEDRLKESKIYEATLDDADVKQNKGSNSSQILKEFFVDMLKLTNQGKFSDISASALSRYFGLSVDPKSLSSGKETQIESPPIDQKDIEADTFVWEEYKLTKFTSADLGNYFALPIIDNKKKPSSFKVEILFIQPLQIIGDKVAVKFTYNKQHQVNNLMKDSKYSQSKKSNWSNESTDTLGTSNIYYGIMKNEFSDGIKICYANIENSRANSFVADPIYGEPKNSGEDSFDKNKGKIKLANGQNTVLSNAKLVYYDKDKKKQTISKTDNIISSECIDVQIKDLKTKGTEKLQESLITFGRKPECKFWN